jgi:hypothetical protein
MMLLRATLQAARGAAWPAILLLSACGTGAQPPASEHSSPTDFSGIWLAQGSNDVLTSIDGGAPPFTADAAALYQQRRMAKQAGDTTWDSTRLCIPPGVPRVMLIQQPFEIAQDPYLVSMAFQYQRLVRFIYQSDAFPENPDASFMGTSRSHWEGAVLVIDTGNFKTGTVLDSSGIPHGPKLRVTERLQRRDADTLTEQITIADEDTFTHPWQAQIVFKRQHGVQVQEDVCVERQRIHP